MAALAERGNQIRAVNRGGNAEVPKGVDRLAADIATPEGARRAVEHGDVVYHCAQPEYTRWIEEFPMMNRTVVDATASAGAKLVFADNLYMYDASRGPITEDTPETATHAYGRLRHEMAADLLEAHRAGRLRVTIGRASDYYGPGGTDSTLGERLFDAIVEGKKAHWMMSLDQPHTCSYTADVGRALVALGSRDEANGNAWVLPAAPALTGRAFIAAAGEAAGTHPKPVALSSTMMRIAGMFVPFLRSYRDMQYQWSAPFTVDASAFLRTFGPFQVTPHQDALTETIAWYRRRHAVAV